MADSGSKDRPHQSHGRFSRFAKLSSVTAGVAARQLSRKVAGAFENEAARDEGDRKAWTESATKIASTMGELKGAAMKVGQMLSTDPDLLPDEVRDALKTLQSEAPPMPFDVVKTAVEEALGGPLSSFFSDFSESPIGAASIGQVHRATTTAGVDVAVKVQYPGIADTIDADMGNLGSLLTLARVKLSRDRVEAYRDEVTAVIRRESDYLFEADMLERFQTIFADIDGVRTPVPLPDLCRKTVLTMTFIDGTRLHTYLGSCSDEDRARLGERLIRAYIDMIHRHGALHADPHPGNFLVDTDGNLVFLDMGCVRDYSSEFTDGLIEILVAMWRGELDELMTCLEAMEFSVDGIDPELIWSWLEIVLEPLLVDRMFDFATWKVHDTVLKFLKDHPSIMGFAPPKEAVFYLRVLAGLRGLIGEGGVQFNAYQTARTAAKDLGFI